MGILQALTGTVGCIAPVLSVTTFLSDVECSC